MISVCSSGRSHLTCAAPNENETQHIRIDSLLHFMHLTVCLTVHSYYYILSIYLFPGSYVYMYVSIDRQADRQMDR